MVKFFTVNRHEIVLRGTVFGVACFVMLLFFSPRLQAQGLGTISGKIVDAKTQEALPNVNVAVLGTVWGASSRADGTYQLKVKAGSYDLRVSVLGYNTLKSKVTVATGQTVTKDFMLEENLIGLGEVVVTGTRRSDRTVVESPVPIDVLTATEIRQTGLTETSQLIQMVIPSFNFPRPTVADGTDHIRPATLRGLGPDQVLVLINGKRRHTTALVHVNGTVGRGSTSIDLNAIPAGSIERIEVLRDGAAAQYGSDAIAGVINIILKSDLQTTVGSTVGQTKESDGEVIQFEGNHGFRIGENGFLHLTGEFRDRGATNRSVADTRQQYFGTLPNGTLTTSGGTPDPREATINRLNHRQGDAETTDGGVFLNGAIPVSNSTSFYTFGGVTRRRGEATGFFRRALDDRTVRAFYPNGFLPEIHSKVFDGSLALGLKGTVTGWAWDLSTVYGTNSFRFDVKNSANVSMGTTSPRDFYAGTLKFGQSTTTLDLFKSVNVGLPAPLSVALGAEFRLDQYKIEAGDRASYIDGGVAILDGPNQGGRAAVGAQVFPGFRPSDEQDVTRNNVGVYVDLENNLAENFLVSAAGRFENYSDFGSTVDGKLAVRFEPVHRFALRGAASTGFRAPSLAQEYFSSTATNFLNVSGVLQPFEVRTFPVSSPEAKALGAKELDAEKSVNLSAGLTLDPVRNLSFTVDYYRTKIDDRIVFSGNFTGTAIRTLLAPFGASGGRFFTNAIDTKTEGFDVIAHYALQLGNASVLKLTGGYNNTMTKVIRVAATPPQLQGFQETLFDRVERGRIEVGQPRNNYNLTANYNLKAINVMVRGIRFGEVTNITTLPANDQTFDAKWIADVDASYNLFGQLKLAVGANNVFDTYPEQNIAANSNSGIFIYNGISPFGFNGRYMYARASYSLK